MASTGDCSILLENGVETWQRLACSFQFWGVGVSRHAGAIFVQHLSVWDATSFAEFVWDGAFRTSGFLFLS